MKRGPYKGSFLWKLCQIDDVVIADAIKKARSIRQLCQILGIEFHGSANAVFRIWAKEHALDISHFLGQRWRKGFHEIGEKTDPTKIFVIRTKKAGTGGIRRALLKIGRPYVCEECGILPEWNGKKLVLQIDHRSGNRLDDREENVRFLCPNCHSQTDTFTSKNRKLKSSDDAIR